MINKRVEIEPQAMAEHAVEISFRLASLYSPMTPNPQIQASQGAKIDKAQYLVGAGAVPS